ncbi:hypothetical protein [Bacteroides pyogenes]|uniref:hypothetical protein n=1 Tax=Bacteroides pyogenes TaxID=310300 RepID=UPI001C49AE8A|nr:hypothetical protein [Bacteroides pyogenes]
MNTINRSSHFIFIHVIAFIFLYLLINYVDTLHIFYANFETIYLKPEILLLYAFAYIISFIYIICNVNLSDKKRILIPFFYFYFYLLISSFVKGESGLEIVKITMWLLMFILGLHYGTMSDETVLFIVKRFLLIIFLPLCIYIVFLLLRSQEHFINPDIYFLLIIFLPYVLLLERGYYKAILLGVMALLFLFSFKRTIIISFVLSLAFFFEVQKRKIFLIIIGVLVFILYIIDIEFVNLLLGRFLALEQDGGSGRDQLYESILTLVFYKSSNIELLFGHGLKSTLSLFNMYAHNDFLQLLVDFGIIGLLLYLLAILKLLIRTFRVRCSYKCYSNAYKATVVLLFVLVFFNCFIYHPYFMPIMMFSFGIINGKILYCK